MQLFIDPSQQRNRRIIQSISQSLWFGRLLNVITAAFLTEPFSALETGFFGRGIGSQAVFDGKDWVFGKGGLSAVDHVDMAGFAVFWIEVAYRTGDQRAPIASLGYIFVVA